MICPSVEEMAALYDGCLPKSLALPLRQHLAQCERCANDFQALHRVREQMQESVPVPKALLQKSVSLPMAVGSRRKDVAPLRFSAPASSTPKHLR